MTAGPERGIWCETAPPEALSDAATWRLLARYRLDVALAVQPSSVGAVAGWMELARAHQVRATVWPMIADGEGRWLSAASAPRFGELLREVRAAAPGADVVLDLEPPFPAVRAALDGRRGAASELLGLVRDTPERREGQRAVASICADIVASGARLTLAVVPMILFDPAGAPGWGLLCGAPEGLPASQVNVMLYTSLIEGYSRGVLRRADALSLLASSAAASAARFGERAAVSVGAVGVGALGDEPVYVEPAALAEDTLLAEAAGVRSLWLFDLGGVLSRAAPEEWLDAFVAPRATAYARGSPLAVPRPLPVSAPSRAGEARTSLSAPPTFRARAAEAALRATGLALAAAGKRRMPFLS